MAPLPKAFRVTAEWPTSASLKVNPVGPWIPFGATFGGIMTQSKHTN